jgi:hypothetical protein
MSKLAPRTVVVEHVIGSMTEIPKPRRAIYSCWSRSARGGDQRWWGAQAPDCVSVYGGVEYGACRRLKKMACVVEKKTVAASFHKAVAATVATKMVALAALQQRQVKIGRRRCSATLKKGRSCRSRTRSENKPRHVRAWRVNRQWCACSSSCWSPLTRSSLSYVRHDVVSVHGM